MEYNLSNRENIIIENADLIDENIISNFLNPSNFNESVELLNEEYKNGNKYPLFIIASFTYTTFDVIVQKVIKKYRYIHAAISFDPSLEKMYSFSASMENGKISGGFVVENIASYMNINPEESYMHINAIYLNKVQYEMVKNHIDHLAQNKDKTKYNFSHIFYVLFKKSEKKPNPMSAICSEFCYSIFKLINFDVLNKASNLVTAQDLVEIKNKRVYKIYEGKVKYYDKIKIKAKLKKLNNTAKYASL